ncbi:hypothetical protein EJB05_56789, partial [Eragrostis curvula]
MEAAKRVCSPSRRRKPALPALLFLLFGSAFLAMAAFAGDTIFPGESMFGNQTLVSKNGVFELGFFSPGPGIHRYFGARFKKIPSSPNFWVGDRITITDLASASLEVFGSSLRNGFMLTIDGHHFPGTFPDGMVSSQDNGSSLVLNYPESPNEIVFLRFLLGQVTLKRWSEGSSANTSVWVPLWTFPSDCKSSGFFCGSFGACTSNNKCNCVKGFEPKYPNQWRLKYFVSGCSRSLPLSCKTNGQTEHDDSFIQLDKLQGLPYNSQYDSAESNEDCREACLSKCYCVAYAYDSGCKLWYNKLYNVSLASKPPYNKVYVRLGSKLRAKNGLHTKGIVLLVVAFIAVGSVIVLLLLLGIYRRDLCTCSSNKEATSSFVQQGGKKKCYQFIRIGRVLPDEWLGRLWSRSLRKGTVSVSSGGLDGPSASAAAWVAIELVGDMAAWPAAACNTAMCPVDRRPQGRKGCLIGVLHQAQLLPPATYAHSTRYG